MTISIELTEAQAQTLTERARLAGKSAPEYASMILEQQLSGHASLEEILAQFREAVDESGVGDAELATMLEDARAEVASRPRP